MLVDTVKRIQSAGIHAHMLPTLHARNVQDVPAYVELSKQLGCTVGFSLLSGTHADLGDLMPDDSCLAELAEIMVEVASKGDAVSIDDAFNPMRALSVRTCCGAGKNSVSVASDGTVYPCHMLHKPSSLWAMRSPMTQLRLRIIFLSSPCLRRRKSRAAHRAKTDTSVEVDAGLGI